MLEQDTAHWKDYDGSYRIDMKHGFGLYLRPGCEYSKKRYIYKIAESNELDYLKTLQIQNFVCLDVGANIGYWSKFLSEISKVKSVHAFEPDPVTCKILENNLVGLNVIVNQVAIGDLDGNLELFLNPLHSGDNRPIFTEGYLPIKVPCLTLDTYVKKANLNRVDFVKIDIQGGEVSALEGSVDLLHRFRPLFLVEIWPELVTVGVGINHYITGFVEQNNYRAYMIENGLPLYLSKSELSEFRGNLFLSPK